MIRLRIGFKRAAISSWRALSQSSLLERDYYSRHSAGSAARPWLLFYFYGAIFSTHEWSKFGSPLTSCLSALDGPFVHRSCRDVAIMPAGLSSASDLVARPPRFGFVENFSTHDVLCYGRWWYSCSQVPDGPFVLHYTFQARLWSLLCTRLHLLPITFGWLLRPLRSIPNYYFFYLRWVLTLMVKLTMAPWPLTSRFTPPALLGQCHACYTLLPWQLPIGYAFSFILSCSTWIYSNLSGLLLWPNSWHYAISDTPKFSNADLVFIIEFIFFNYTGLGEQVI